MGTVTGFPPIADSKAVILILGSMPSIKSLQAHQYYAHPYNSFWFIMSALFADNGELDYNARKSLLLHNRIALWDVLDTCQREGSLDSSIKNETIVVNDFNTFFVEHPLIQAVYFNGTRAQQEYNRQVLPKLDEKFSSIEYQRLPSTSPAMASLSREQKLQQWKAILKHLD
ncbi:MAG: DNA-deoxyinosine glycosylase [Gammaproteobacteria bacterium]|nr:DNA-deoxyinosine glycosylase [Gammaproteobacteria bacterium]